MTGPAPPFREPAAAAAVHGMEHPAWVVELPGLRVIADNEPARHLRRTLDRCPGTGGNGSANGAGEPLNGIFGTDGLSKLIDATADLKIGAAPVRIALKIRAEPPGSGPKRQLQLACRRLPPLHTRAQSRSAPCAAARSPTAVLLIEVAGSPIETKAREEAARKIGFPEPGTPSKPSAPAPPQSARPTRAAKIVTNAPSPIPGGPRDASGRPIRIDRAALPADDRAKLDDIARRINAGSGFGASEDVAHTDGAAPLDGASPALTQPTNRTQRGTDRPAPAATAGSPVETARRLRFIGHELKTPLGAIQTLAEILRDGYGADADRPLDPQRAKTYADDIVTCAMHALDVVNTGLATKGPPKSIGWRSNNNASSRAEDNVDLGQIAEATVKALQPSASAQRIRLAYFGPATAAHAKADPRNVRQILFNLVGNALKFTNTGDRISVIVRRDLAGRWVLAVRDTGRGMTRPELTARLASTRASAANSADDADEAPRAGLGLKIVSELAHRDGADMTIDSRLGAGTRVAIVFPSPAPADVAKPAITPGA